MLFSLFLDSHQQPCPNFAHSLLEHTGTHHHPCTHTPPTHPEDWRGACLSFVTLTAGIEADGGINVLEVCLSNIVHPLH